MTTVQVDEKTAAALAVLQSRAEQNRLPLDELLRGLAETLPEATNGPAACTDWEAELDDLAAESDDVPPLPVDFSRADIYAEHD